MSSPALLPMLAPHLHFAGVDPRLLDEARLRWTVESRCRELGLNSTQTYLAQLASSPAEIEALMESVVVGETRFFRDRSVFAGIRQWAAEVAGKIPGTLRILSAPCSTGQEAYSVAATLAEAGIAPERFSIDALDISEGALRVARRGVYPESAMRGIEERERRALAHVHEDRWLIHETLKQRVRFLPRNLAEAAALQGERYHLILCRNLFIYLHADARATLAATLAEGLHPGGRLVIGTADHVPELNAVFAPLQPASAFALVARTEAAITRAAPPAPRAETEPARASKPTAPKPAAIPFSPYDEALQFSAEDLLQRALESQRVGNVRLAERRCRQALYVDPAYLPAMELLDTLWHSSASVRMRAALTARIHRLRGLEAGQ